MSGQLQARNIKEIDIDNTRDMPKPIAEFKILKFSRDRIFSDPPINVVISLPRRYSTNMPMKEQWKLLKTGAKVCQEDPLIILVKR